VSQQLKSRFGWPLIGIGLALFCYSAIAFAQQVPASTVDYPTVFNLLAGLLISMIGVYAKTLSVRITDNRDDIKALSTKLDEHKIQLARDHHTKQELRAMMTDAVQTLTERITENRATTLAVHRRLDEMGIKPAFPRDAS
jgi:type VI protein secretion system component VasK